jgi:hypothetical protein
LPQTAEYAGPVLLQLPQTAAPRRGATPARIHNNLLFLHIFQARIDGSGRTGKQGVARDSWGENQAETVSLYLNL